MPPCKKDCSTLPCTCIGTPTLFKNWDGNLFPDGTSPTWTFVYEDYFAYGYDQLHQFWFFVELPSGKASEFANAHEQWTARQLNRESHFYSLRDKPPDCGTPNTPTCPPDPLLPGAIRYLRDLKAGPGASLDALNIAAAEVENALVKVIWAELMKLKARLPQLDPPTRYPLRSAIHYLRELKVGPAPNVATVDRFALWVETLLVDAITAEAAKFFAFPPDP